MNEGKLLGSGHVWSKTVPYDGLLEIIISTCCGNEYVSVNNRTVASSMDDTPYSSSEYTRIYVKAGDIIKASGSQWAHPESPSSATVYIYPYKN